MISIICKNSDCIAYKACLRGATYTKIIDSGWKAKKGVDTIKGKGDHKGPCELFVENNNDRATDSK